MGNKITTRTTKSSAEKSGSTMQAKEEEFAVEVRDAPPAHLLVKIQQFSKLLKHGIQEHESREFVAGKYRWKLIIYPNGCDCNNEDKHISVYLSVADADTLPEGWKVKANCSIFLHNQISDNYLCYRVKARRFDAMHSKWGFSVSKRMFAKPSHGYLVDDKCVFGAEVFLSKKTAIECLSLFDWKISDFNKLKKVWTSEVFHAGGLRWRMMLFPNGNAYDGAEGKSVSIYLECIDSKKFAPHEKVTAHICIRIKSKLPYSHCSKYTCHSFISGGYHDWGFTNFMPITDMLDPNKGFIIDGCCFLETEITVLDVVYTPK